MVTGLPGLSGVTVPRRVAAVLRDAEDHVQIHLPVMADGIALASRRRCRAATPEGAQVTYLAFRVLYNNKSKMITKRVQ